MKHKLIYTLFIMLIISSFSCSKDSDKVTPTTYIITPDGAQVRYDGSIEFKIERGGKVFDNTDFEWSSSDNNRGTFDAPGILTAKKVGEISIEAKKPGTTISTKVEITPYQTFLTEPLTEIGTATKADVKSFESRKELGETDAGILFEGENDQVRDITYLFDDEGKLMSVIVRFPETTKSASDVSTFYIERYTLITKIDDYYLMKPAREGDYNVGFGISDEFGLSAIYFKEE